MMNEKEYLLNELLEHTMDCDCAKSQHFYDENECRKKARIFNWIQSIVFLITIGTYVLIVSGVKQYGWLNFLGIALALISTLLEVMSYMLNFEEDAMNHWKAAQMYSELYRKCQFFYSNHLHDSVDVWREKLEEISEELSRISLLAPAVSSESYAAWSSYGYEKKYPTHKAVNDLKIGNIAEVIEVIKKTLADYKIEIYLFGSYLKNMFYNDIDIAVVIHEEESVLPLEQKMNEIEKNYSAKGLDLDITIITEKDIIANRCTQFVKNICNGLLYYKSLEVKKSISEYSGILVDYSEMICYFMNKASESENDYRGFIGNVFYMYYHFLTALLDKYNINWYGERSLLSESEFLENDIKKIEAIGLEEEQYISILSNARLFMDKKNKAYVGNVLDDGDFEQLKKLFTIDKEAISKVVESGNLVG